MTGDWIRKVELQNKLIKHLPETEMTEPEMTEPRLR